MTHHLGSQLSELVDGRLSPIATDRVLVHVAACAQCADELAAARLARRALAAAACDDVPQAPDLTARLMSLAPAAPVPAACGTAAARDPFAQPLGVPAVHGRRARALRGEVAERRLPRIAAGSLAGVGAIAAMLFVLGDRPVVAPVGHPGADLDLLGSASAGTSGSSGTLASGASSSGSAVNAVAGSAVDETQGIVASLRARGWSFPDTLPEGWSVSAVRWVADERVLEVDLASAEGTLVVTEQEGRLDTSVLARADRVSIGGHETYVLSYAPWHVVWQCGSTVVQVVAGGDASSFVEAFPVAAFDGGVPARISRGWSTVAGALDGR
ncbi:MAG: zf-HC2 domain-containing protein [Cellulomonas sp.]|uniref:zf-HC2 domain-containing protein n=1 Tax=Cellulomonas sp. TaxID=40001 RepID=UPI0025855F3C|nr:zf-HC2 domain-containing protein [Cellulomonas sp.]MCR6705858.1 zf-HC2 domain-containing protein [Cellulomonas sp.]